MVQLPVSIQNFQRLYQGFSAKQKPRYNKLIVLGVITILLDLFGLALLYLATMNILDSGYIKSIDRLHKNLPSVFSLSERGSLYLTGALVALFVVKNGATFMIAKLQLQTAYNLASEKSSQQFNHFLSRGLISQKSTQSVDYIHELFSLPNSMADHMIMASVNCISEIIFIILTIFILVVVKPGLLLLLALTILPVTLVMLYVNRKKLVSYSEKVHKIVPRLWESVSNTVHGFSDIRLQGKESHFKTSFEKWRSELFKYRKSAYLLNITPAKVMESAAVIGLFMIALYTFLIGNTSNMTSLLALFAALAFRVLPSINRIMASFNTFNSVSFMLDFLHGKENIAGTRSSLESGFNDKVELVDIHLELNGTGTVLSGLNLTIAKGEMIGIMGGSGEGKTSLLNLILCFYSPSQGDILVDGRSILGSHSQWQNKLAYVEQSSFMLPGTILENIAFGSEEANRDEVFRVLEKASLTEWVDSLEEGLMTRIGEQGTRISAGQKQRLAIARALYSKSEVFIFDEATNALDAKTKAEVMSTIKRLKEMGFTIIIAAHDPGTLSDCDKVYNLRQGELHEKKL